MHSRIFEVVKVDDRADYTPTMCEADFYDYIPHKFDYVNSDTDLKDDIKWLKTCSPMLFVGEDVIEISKQVAEKFFENRFEEFKSIINEITLSEFIGEYTIWEHSVYHIGQLLNTNYEFYIFEGGFLYSLDDFIRGNCNLKSATSKYKIVSSMDYHF